jgi:hypothetical protein
MINKQGQQGMVDEAGGNGDPVGQARDLIAALLNRDDELHLGMAVFDLWAAFDELVDPLTPPPPPRPVWIEDPAQAMRDARAKLSAAIETAETQNDALSHGRAAHNVANALATFEQWHR